MKKIIAVAAVCALLFCGLIISMGFIDKENATERAAAEYLNGRDYFELDESEKASLYGKVSDIEFERLKKAGKLPVYVDPNENREQPYDVDVYYENVIQIKSELRTYGYLGGMYGNEYLRFSIIDDADLELQYIELVLQAFEKGMVDEQFITFECACDFISFLYYRQDKFSPNMVKRFAVISDFYKEKYGRD